MEKTTVVCEMEVTVKMIGGKYKALILEYLINDGTKRFNEIMNYISNITQKSLTTQLRELESDGLITRKVYPEVPPKVEYTISEKGMTLSPILDLMCEWGKDHLDERFDVLHPLCD